MRKTSEVQRVTTRRAALLTLGRVVYAVRIDSGAIKFGCTGNLDNRLHTIRHQSGSATTELLAFEIGGFDDEKALHSRLDSSRIAGKREYYHPTPEVMAIVNGMRARLSQPPLAS